MKIEALKMLAILVLSSIVNLPISQAADSQSAFEKLKSLQGVWSTDLQDVREKEVSFEVTAKGSALIERTMGMVTVYHLDGPLLMATHYCESLNQPRFVASDFSNENIIDFNFKDITNAKTGEGFISHIKFEFLGADSVSVTWTWSEGGTQQTFNANLNRKK
jgi:hypothetical protein